MKIVRTLIALTLLAVLVALAGCAAGPAGGASSATKPAQGTESPAEPPTIEITAPTDGATVASGSVKVEVQTANLEFTMPSNTLVPGQGHVHFTLDDEPFEMSVEPEFTFENVAPGEHRLKAELVQNDTSSFEPPVVQEVTFTVK